MQKILILSLILFYFSSCDKKENNNDIKESETKFNYLITSNATWKFHLQGIYTASQAEPNPVLDTTYHIYTVAEATGIDTVITEILSKKVYLYNISGEVFK